MSPELRSVLGSGWPFLAIAIGLFVSLLGTVRRGYRSPEEELAEMPATTTGTIVGFEDPHGRIHVEKKTLPQGRGQAWPNCMVWYEYSPQGSDRVIRSCQRIPEPEVDRARIAFGIRLVVRYRPQVPGYSRLVLPPPGLQCRSG